MPSNLLYRVSKLQPAPSLMSTPELMIVDNNDDNPLPGRPKGTGKKEKSHAYTQEELDGLGTLFL